MILSHVQVPNKRSVSGSEDWFVNIYDTHVLYLQEDLICWRDKALSCRELLDRMAEAETVTF